MRMKQFSWMVAGLIALSALGCGGTPERQEVSVEDLEQKAAAGAKINTKGAEMRLEQRREREDATGEATP
ncbi:MAG: hypothetical protein RBU21_04685 [FCB group bacterium]|nr:hypothetical protein [FCB group bacterium]